MAINSSASAIAETMHLAQLRHADLKSTKEDREALKVAKSRAGGIVAFAHALRVTHQEVGPVES